MTSTINPILSTVLPEAAKSVPSASLPDLITGLKDPNCRSTPVVIHYSRRGFGADTAKLVAADGAIIRMLHRLARTFFTLGRTGSYDQPRKISCLVNFLRSCTLDFQEQESARNSHTHEVLAGHPTNRADKEFASDDTLPWECLKLQLGALLVQGHQLV